MVFKSTKGMAVNKKEYGNNPYLDEIKRPKAFHLPTIQMMLLYPPTNRYVLWIISNAPYAYNVYFFGRFVQKNPKLIDEGAILKRALNVLSVLHVQKMIKRDENDNWKITVKGELYRLASHPNFGFYTLSFGADLQLHYLY